MGSSLASHADHSPTRKRMRRSDRRHQLLSLAEEILLEDGGSAALTMERLAEKAGIAKTVVYSHFSNASEVSLAVLERHWTDLHDQFVEATRHEPSVTGKLEIMVRIYFGASADRRMQLRRLFFKILHDPKVSAEMRARQQALETEAVRLLMEETEIDARDAPLVANFLLGAVGRVGSRKFDTPQDFENAVAGFLQMATAVIQSMQKTKAARPRGRTSLGDRGARRSS
ncbi:MAG: TetR/AcrR family transcriptional regulator [Alphaproteobacteria bacterium]|nr:TetR/AcrR family transcriptional regulator [Alphaproteobacteria bacterium]